MKGFKTKITSKGRVPSPGAKLAPPLLVASPERRTLPVITRKCGSCSACCYVLSVREGNTEVDVEKQEITEHGFSKPRYTQCVHLKQGNHCCGIYETRPEPCKTYTCAWLHGLGSNAMRPDKSHIVFSLDFTLLGLTLLGLETREGYATEYNPMVQLALKVAHEKNSGLIIGGKVQRRILRIPPGKEGVVEAAILQAKNDGLDLQRG